MVQASVYASIGTLIDLAESPPPHQSSCLSISRKLLKKALNISRPVAKSSTPIISRTECIESCGSPTSTARIPVAAEMIGPMVDPQGQSLRTTNSCGGGRAARRAISRSTKLVTGFDAYRWLALDLITRPELSFGPCARSCFDR